MLSTQRDQELVDLLHDLYMACVQQADTQGFAYLRFGQRVASLMELAAGRQFEVRQILPPPTNPPMRRVK